jgi:hypothetical protein
MREKEAGRRYMIELFSGLGIYMVLLFAAITYAPGMPRASGTALMVSPMIGFCLALWAIVRQFARMDEYQHLRSLQAIAIAAAVTAGWTFTYGFLENAGYPRLSMFTIWPVMGAVWGGVVCGRRLLNL